MSNHSKRFRVLITTAACCAWGILGCGSSASEYGDVPIASGGQLRWEFATGAPAPWTLLVLVDDTEAGTSLRQALAESFDDWDASLAMRRGSCAQPVDPAAWQPIDRSVVFVHPSTPGAMGYWSPAQDPALRQQAQHTFGAERSRWLAAVRAGINSQPAAPGAAFQALAALENAQSLLRGSRAPENTAETELLDALPNPADFSTLIALATDDASPGEANQYPGNDPSELLGIVLPAALPGKLADCSEKGVPTTARYRALSESAQAWPCDNPDFFFNSGFWSDCSTRCLPQPIASDGGLAQCRVMANYPGSEPCPAEFGWLDPLDAKGQRTPRVDGSGSKATRSCEIRQLEGAALASCVTRLDCSDCEPGWCATEVAELVPQERCATGGVYPPFRFVLGAAQARDAQVTIVCNEALL